MSAERETRKESSPRASDQMNLYGRVFFERQVDPNASKRECTFQEILDAVCGNYPLALKVWDDWGTDEDNATIQK